MIDTKAIRAKVLDLAIRGKLTEQRPEDGTAEELLCQIRLSQQEAEKSQGTKVSKSSPVVTDGDRPFSIPDTWLWVRMGDVFSHNTGKALNSSVQTGTLLEYITTSNVYWDRFELSSLKSMYFTDEEVEKCTIRQGDLLICEGGDIGRSAIWPYDSPMRIQNHIHRLRSYSPSVDVKLYYYVMRLYKIKGMISGRGIGLEGFSSKRLHSLVIPLPPANEQHRIVATIDAIFSLLDTIDTLQSAYTANQKALRAKLIDAAIRGQLTEQLPEDGTAEELYQQIQAEKAALEKAGKIKKSKPLPPVTEEEKPFEIPGNWKWVRFSDLMLTISTGPFGSMLHKSDYVNNGIPLVNPMNIVSGRIIPSDKMMVSEESRLRLASYVLHEGMIVMGRRGEMGRCAIVNQNENGWLCGTGSFFMEPSNCILVQYVIFLLSTIYAKTYLGGQSIGMTMSNLNHTILTKMPIPLPPLAEQKRIVARLEELLAVCEG